ncbi:MAG TPA: major capsid protein [Pyrinomonadaceae bacterium]|nr:major capsid protein [Pyrinomonadaceae bacterium]
MITYRFPTNVSVDGVLQEFVRDSEKLKGIKLMPFVNKYTQRVVWDYRDRERGATAPHNMGADPKIGNRPGSNRVEFTPIPHKETDLLTERDILDAAALGTLGGVVELTSEIGRITRERAEKNYVRAEIEIWQALRGHLQINENGVRVDEVFPVQTYNAEVDWDEVETAKILSDLAAVGLKFPFTGASGRGAVGYLNQVTANWVLGNRNPDDLFGFQNQNFLKLPYSLEEVNKILTARGVPTLEVYDEGYVDEGDDEVRFIEDGEVIVIGKRAEPVGDYALTPTTHRQENGKNAPGFFSIIEVNGQPNPGAVTVAAIGSGKNPKVEITGGFYGGPRLLFPRSVVRMNVKVS